MKILFYGPIAKSGKPAGGGFEAANRKNIDVLKQNGVDVVEYANPHIRRQFGTIAKVSYLKLLFLPLSMIKYKRAKNVVVHTTPLYNHFLWYSIIVVYMAKLLHLPILLDIRAGSLIYLSQRKSKIWLRGVTYVLNNASVVTVEGKSYIYDIPKVFGTKTKILYFPNITSCHNMKYSKRDNDHINLIYFGRITKSKGSDILLRMMKLLDSRYKLYLAGNISKDMNDYNFQGDNVVYLGSLSPKDLYEVLQKMHIFLFPTKWFGEGQSNSLIEAMQNGLIPISADQGFCRDVIGDCGIILPSNSNEVDYRDAILNLSNEDISVLGMRAMKRIEEFHNIDVWIPWLIKLYTEILERN